MKQEILFLQFSTVTVFQQLFLSIFQQLFAKSLNTVALIWNYENNNCIEGHHPKMIC